LEAVDFLAEEISGAGAGDVSALIRAIETLVYSLHFIGPDIPAIVQTDAEPPQLDYRQVYQTVRQRYSALGHYWVALHPVMEEGTEGEIAVGDAIDDLADIFIALGDVRWFAARGDRQVALAALRWRYDMHLWMHFHELRQYLEEVKRDG
jgi:hypothetical protein